MLDIGWSELLLIGVVALIVVGPKDLPRMFHALGRFTAKARGMAREFQRAMDDAAKTSGFADATKDIKNLTSKKALGIDALESAAAKFEKWDPTKSALASQGPATKALADKKAQEVASRAAVQSAKRMAKDAATEMADDLADESAVVEPVAAKPVLQKPWAPEPNSAETPATKKPVVKKAPLKAAEPAATDAPAKPAPKPRAPRATKPAPVETAAPSKPARRKKSDT